jgi:hypothetical protein
MGNMFKRKPSSLLFLILAVGTLISAYFNYRSDKLLMSGVGVVISIACFVYYWRDVRSSK